MNSRVLIKTPDAGYVNFNPLTPQVDACDPFETVRSLPPRLGQGQFTTFDIGPDLDIGLSLCQFDRDYRARISWPSPKVCFGFGLSGKTLTHSSCCRTPVVMAPGQAYVHYFQDPVLERETFSGKDLRAVVIRVAPQRLTGMLDPAPRRDTKALDRLNRALEDGYLLANHAMTSQMTAILFQMFNCPHQGIIRKIYMESKALELIALKLEQMTSGRLGEASALDPDERERILGVRDRLLNHLQYPPSLDELARQAGMSHPRLNRGFRRVFGCTVFAYLRRERLALAQMLMEEGKMTLTQVAFKSGFCSSSHFASAFMGQYGIRPSDYYKSKKKKG